jgi:hypothetical protein
LAPALATPKGDIESRRGSGSFRQSSSPRSSGKAVWSRLCPTGGSAPTTFRSSRSGTATSPSHAGSSRISRCKWRQVCFPACRPKRLTLNLAAAIGHHEQQQAAPFTSVAPTCNDRFTSILLKNSLFWAPAVGVCGAVSEADSWIFASCGEDERRERNQLRQFSQILGCGG